MYWLNLDCKSTPRTCSSFTPDMWQASMRNVQFKYGLCGAGHRQRLG
jgi:hypothetical protein